MKKLLGILQIYGILFLGALLAALGVSLFLMPVNLVAGGLSGIGILVHALTGFPVGAFMLLLNIPLFILGFRRLGVTFLCRSFFCAFMFSILIDITAFIPPITDDLLLSALAGGALSGLGIGLVFLFGATTGGTDILAQLLHQIVSRFEVGKLLLLADALIILTSGIVFGNWERCLYGVVAAVCNGILIDTIQQGANFAKVVFVMSPQAEAIARDIMGKMTRGVTGLYSRGMYTKSDAIMLLCVIKKQEINKFKQIVLAKDPNAFIIFSAARSVAGEGFKIYPIN